MKEQLVFNFSTVGLGADSFLPTRTCLTVEEKTKRRRELANKRSARWRDKNRAKAIAATRRWYEMNRERHIMVAKSWRTKNKEKSNAWLAEYSQKYKPRRLYLERKRRAKKPEYFAEKQRKLMAKNKSYKISQNLRSRINSALRGAQKASSTEAITGCSFQELVKWIESKFKPGMTWENYGKFGWHIDHIRPCASFDLTKPEEQAECFHYTNLQPLWAHENLSKSDKPLTSAKHHGGQQN